MLVKVTWPRGVGDWKESKSTAQPADSEDRVEVMCCSGADRRGIQDLFQRKRMCEEEEETINICTHTCCTARLPCVPGSRSIRMGLR